jgi:hypothetical protein
LLGVLQIAQRPDVLLALKPLYGLELLANSPWRSFRNQHLAVPRNRRSADRLSTPCRHRVCSYQSCEHPRRRAATPEAIRLQAIRRVTVAQQHATFDSANESSLETSEAQQRAEQLTKHNFWQDFLR